MKKRKSIILVGKALFALLLIYYLFQHDILNKSSINFFRNNYCEVILLALYTFLIFLFCATRWWILLNIQNIKVPFWMIFRISYFSTLCGLILPGVMSGDFVRLFASKRVSLTQRNKVVFSIVFDRILGVSGLIIIGLTFSFIVNPQSVDELYLYNGLKYFVFSVGLTLAVIFVFLSLSSRIYDYICVGYHDGSGWLLRLLHDFTGSVVMYSRSPGYVMFCLLVSIASHMIAISSVYIISRIMESALGIGEIAISSSLAFLSNFIPLTPGGIGIGEGVISQVVAYISSVENLSVYSNSFFVFRIISIITLLPSFVFIIKKISQK